MDSIFFWLSKIAWLLLSPDILLLILILCTWLLLRLGSYPLAKKIHTFVAVACLLIAFFPLGEWLLYPLETRFPTNPELPRQIDGIIVLSGAEDAVLSAQWNQVELGDGAERYIAFFNLARQYPNARLIFTGGSGSMIDQSHKGADVAKTLFQSLGLDSSRVIFERESRNTYENAIYSKKIASPAAGEKWLLITTAWHMPRSMGIFAKAGWPMIAYPVDHQTSPDNLFRINLAFAQHLSGVKTAIREWLGLAAYRLSGRTAVFFPGPKPKPAMPPLLKTKSDI